MGRNDNPQKSKLLTYLLVIVIAAGFVQTIWSEAQAKELKSQLERQEQLLKQQEEKLEEQGSRIDQHLQQIQNLRDENIHLKDTLEKQQGQYEETIKQKDDKIKSLNEELVIKQRARTKAAYASLPSRSTNVASKEIYMEATAYTAYCNGCSGVTAMGINLRSNPDAKVIAVDPKIIPLGTKVYVEGYGYAIAADKGGAIKGYKIDVFIPTKAEAYKWGRKKVKVRILANQS